MSLKSFLKCSYKHIVVFKNKKKIYSGVKYFFFSFLIKCTHTHTHIYNLYLFFPLNSLICKGRSNNLDEKIKTNLIENLYQLDKNYFLIFFLKGDKNYFLMNSLLIEYAS